MAIRNITKEGDAVLRKNARIVTSFDARLGILLDDMKETMFKADGCGIAAQQVGILKSAVLVYHEEKLYELINPIISETEGEEVAVEGCLSVSAEKNCAVKRPTKLKVNYQDRTGTPIEMIAEGWLARIICHECDHLQGKLFIDRKVEGGK
ncbi:MAG: peptide deformylase [Bacillota bacterium]